MEAASQEMMRDHWNLQRDLEEARKQVDIADELAVSNAVSRQMNQSIIVSGMSQNEARQAVDVLEDQLLTMERARQHIANQMVAVKRDYDFSISDVNRAIDALKWSSPEVRRLFHEVKIAQRTTLELRAACSACGVPPKDLELCLAVNPSFSEELAGKWSEVIRRLVNEPTIEFPD
jgi:predicted XRE-type DNA-binding protein